MLLLFGMMLCGISIGLLRGGDWHRLEKIRLHHPYLPVLALMLQLVSHNLFLQHQGTPTVALMDISYLLVLVFLWLNRFLPGFAIISLGWALNFLAVAANHGRMPVYGPMLERFNQAADLTALLSDTYFKHGAVLPQTRLLWLTDIIYLPFPTPHLFSIGDIMLYMGLGYFLYRSVGRV